LYVPIRAFLLLDEGVAKRSRNSIAARSCHRSGANCSGWAQAHAAIAPVQGTKAPYSAFSAHLRHSWIMTIYHFAILCGAMAALGCARMIPRLGLRPPISGLMIVFGTLVPA